ncbi:MAG: glutaredoxin family protein [Burkholderiales bacterium]|nr:glutaredoxin family protein [Burkholderiales bacterium]
MALLAGTASAQYKVVGPDGRITYTDRPPADAGKVTPLSRSANSAATPLAALPLELRQAVQRYPVTLYTSGDCPPCESGRKLLAQRGVPVTEKLVTSNDDVQALERIVGAITVPSLTVGGQVLRGYSEADWQSYLDAAGYPRESKLPRGYTASAPSPLVQRSAAAEPARAEPPAPTPPPETPAEPTPGNIRF